ncbi:hypothetical protein HBB16_21415 [Pseudonocardia sp. MCCB 268]|nr:hypothetical protein [Pseudonocardia cytotoxica]
MRAQSRPFVRPAGHRLRRRRPLAPSVELGSGRRGGLLAVLTVPFTRRRTRASRTGARGRVRHRRAGLQQAGRPAWRVWGLRGAAGLSVVGLVLECGRRRVVRELRWPCPGDRARR